MYWDDIAGQDGAVRFLRRALSRGRLPHFALLWGAPGVGKTMAARALAAAALCETPPTDGAAARDVACGQCDGLVTAQQHSFRVPHYDIRIRFSLEHQAGAAVALLVVRNELAMDGRPVLGTFDYLGESHRHQRGLFDPGA